MGKGVEVLETETSETKFRIVELPVDPPNTIRRYLVPANTPENDIELGARMLDVRETDGHLARSARPDNILVGDLVRRAVKVGIIGENAGTKGTVEAKLKENRFRIRFEDGTVDRLEAKDLSKVW